MITAILVRHADRDDGDAPLNDKGRARAVALARIVGLARVGHIFTSTAPRTAQTAEPLARLLDLTPKAIDAGTDLAAAVRALSNNDVALIVGHSNTVPEAIAALGVPSPSPTIGDHDFDNLFIVTIGLTGPPALVQLRYGEVD